MKFEGLHEKILEKDLPRSGMHALQIQTVQLLLLTLRLP